MSETLTQGTVQAIGTPVVCRGRPCIRGGVDRFEFSVGRHDLRWTVEKFGIRIDLVLGLPVDDVAELWSMEVTNLSDRPRRISVLMRASSSAMANGLIR